MTNAFFLPVVWDGSLSKVQFYKSSEFKQCDPDTRHQLDNILRSQLMAEFLFSSTASVAVFAFMSLTSTHSSNVSLVIKSNLCLIKSALFAVAQLILKNNHQQLQQGSQTVQDLVSEHIRNVLYEHVDGAVVYLNDFFWSSMVYNMLLIGYSLAAKFQNCNGPLGPNGEPTCMGQAVYDGILNYLQILFNSWVAVSFLKKGVTNAQFEFPMANRINDWVAATFCQPIYARFVSPQKVTPNDYDFSCYSDEECKV